MVSARLETHASKHLVAQNIALVFSLELRYHGTLGTRVSPSCSRLWRFEAGCQSKPCCGIRVSPHVRFLGFAGLAGHALECLFRGGAICRTAGRNLVGGNKGSA